MSSLPFLSRKRKETGVIIQERAPDESKEVDSKDMAPEALKAAAEDILRAINDNDSEHLALAIRNAFEICDSYPHTEGEHTDDSDE